MLSSITKHKIDAARDILVGKIPVPTAQVEQITLALVYKFMSDLDKQAKAAGDVGGFFANGYEQYAWDNFIDKSLSATQKLKLYAEGLEKMSQNPHIPQLFRDIFRDAYLPFRDPEVLKLFLEQIGEFTYDNSEELGNAFEYLLQVMGSQGDAGQFRTPRHIIDFIVACVEPDKHDRILDPACGTAGFLISAYKYLVEKGLTATEKAGITNNFTGYDISHEMVRLSRVNMYLHYFGNPNIMEYDTLSDLTHWDEEFDTIVANPPFMSPKGGIRPHNRFQIQAKRSEVLFVDYILEHLSTTGKAGIIVPEGIIFQSANAYKDLRKLLVDSGYLWGVISLPSGVFNPYAGVKTSILLIDKTIAVKSKDILFVKISNDGYDLGAQRRPIVKNDFPLSLKNILQYKKGELLTLPVNFTLVSKQKILKSSDLNLSVEKYQDTKDAASLWPIVRLSEICEKITDGTHNSPPYVTEGIPMLDSKDINDGHIDDSGVHKCISKETDAVLSKRCKPRENDILVSSRGSIGKLAIVKDNQDFNIMGNIILLRPSNKVDPLYLYQTLKNFDFDKEAHGIAQKGLYLGQMKTFEVPLPPLEIQQQIVGEINLIEEENRNLDDQIKKNKSKVKKIIDEVWGK